MLRIETGGAGAYHGITSRTQLGQGLDSAMTTDMQRAPITDVAGVIMADGAGRFLLQRRDNDPRISSPNRLSMFGGHKEGAENAQTCALREVEEETGCALRPDQIELVAATHTLYPNGVLRAGSFFFADHIDPGSFVVTEGKLEIIPFAALPEYFHQMVPTTAYTLALLSSEIIDGQRKMSGVEL